MKMIQEIIKSAIVDTIVEYSISEPTKTNIEVFIKDILTYNTSTLFTEVVMNTMNNNINAGENPAIIYSFLMDIGYKINLDMLSIDKDFSLNELIINISDTHMRNMSKSLLFSDESFKVYEQIEVGGLDIVLYLLVQNKFKLIEMLKKL